MQSHRHDEPAEWPHDVGRPGPEGPEPGAHDSAYELLQRGQALLRRRHDAQATIVLERAARLEPGKGSILEALGRAYYNSGQHARSAETFEALLEVDPTAHYAHYALGQSLKQVGRLREARTHLRLAVALDPSSRLYRGALDRLPPSTRKPEAGPTEDDGAEGSGDDPPAAAQG